MILIKVLALIIFISKSKSQKNFMPTLPLGEYRVVYEKMYPCESTRNHSFKFNVFFSKKTQSITELKGNLTLLIPYDDSNTLDVNFASWGLTGGWKPNALVYITKNACSQLKFVLGKMWYAATKGFKFPNVCPIPAGTYVTSGIDVKEFEEINFPKVFFYGKYKGSFKMKNKKNEVIGCGVAEVQLVRPWEKLA